MKLGGVVSRLAKAARRVRMRVRYAFARQPIVARWEGHGIIAENFGDKLNPYLIARLSGRPVFHADDLGARAQREVLFAIGSMLGAARENAVVWGTGFMTGRPRASRPGRIAAVRGPLSRAKLLDAGVTCPAVFGDPALLLPVVYSPRVTGRDDIGFIPHVRELDLDVVAGVAALDGVRLIDVTLPIGAFVDAVADCRLVLSSSLHGIICAHAYRIPARWVRLSDRILGDGFKFRDYLASVGLPQDGPDVIDGPADVGRLIAREIPPPGRIDLRPLIRACPFIDEARMRQLEALLPPHLSRGQGR